MTGPTGAIRSGDRIQKYRLDGQTVSRVTDALSKGYPKKALQYWAAREVAGAAFDNLERLQGLERDAVVDLLKGAPWRDLAKAAKKGTDIHRFAEQLAQGDEVEVPDELIGHVDAYLDFTERWNPTPTLTETSVFSRKWKYAGTLDLIANLPGLGVCLIDIKTGASGVYPETGLQLAAYRFADFWLTDDGIESPLPNVDWTGVLWLRADGWDLLPVRAGPDEWRQFLYCKMTAEWIDDVAAGIVGPALPPPNPPQLEVVR